MAYVGDDVGLPADGAGLEVVIEELAGFVADGSGISMPGFFGFITTGGSTSAIAAQAAAAGMGGQRYLLHAFNDVEHLALRWLAELCGIPPSAAGVFTSGGSTANLVALGAARQWTFEQRGVDVAETGLPASPYRIYASARSHRTIHRAAAVLGMGRSSVCEIPTDTGGHLEVDALEAALVEDGRKGIVPAAIVAVAGTTDTGTVDDLARVGEIARRRGCWLHVDGAYGLVARACEDVRPLFEGVEEADSWIIDPHKWLATGVGTGAVYVRDGALLTRAFAEGPADYLEGSFAADEGPPVSQFDGIGGWWADQAVELSAPPAASPCGRSCARSVGEGSNSGCVSTSASPGTSQSGCARILAWSCCASPSCRSCASATDRRRTSMSTRTMPRSSNSSAGRPRRSRRARWWTASSPSVRASSTRGRREQRRR